MIIIQSLLFASLITLIYLVAVSDFPDQWWQFLIIVAVAMLFGWMMIAVSLYL